jgi:DnaJ homolog subfamily C member 25
MRYNQEAYYQKYGASVLWKYAPKSDVTIIGTLLFILVNAFSWFAQKNKWQNVADRLIKAAAEDWSSSQGGSPESKELREHALALLAERENNNEDAETSSNNGAAEKSSKKSKGKKVSGKEKKKQELEALIPVLKELVDEMDDFGGGFHKPTWRDLLIVNLAMLPYKLAVGTVWEAKYYMKEVLTQRAVGPVAWDLASDETRETMIKRELWILNNLVEWKEEEEIKNLSAWEQKAIRKAQKAEKKKGSKQA